MANYWITGNGLQECKEHPELERGTIIIAVGPGLVQTRWAADGNGMCIRLTEPYDDDYFSCKPHYIDRYMRPISEQFGIGFYYDLSQTKATDEEIAAAIERNNAFIAQQEEEKRKAAEKYASYGYNTGKDAKNIAVNIRIDLAREFPGQKFSVRKRDYDCINVEWLDGPTTEEVEQIISKHKLSRTIDHYNIDLYNYSESAFNAIFGGVKYLFCYRTVSDSNIATIIEQEGVTYDRAAKMARETSYYTRPAEQQTAAESNGITIAESNGISLIDYSAKAIAVVGETKAIKDTLKSMGGRFNPRLTCGAGWIFSKSKEQSVRLALNL